ncbi:RNA methyltransferase, partial [Paracoccus siganidrum]
PHARRSDSDAPADRIEIERLGDRYEEGLEAAGFFFPETKAASMRLNLRNMWSRLSLTRGDVRILHGILRQLTRR